MIPVQEARIKLIFYSTLPKLHAALKGPLMSLFKNVTFHITVASLNDLPTDSVCEIAFAGRSNVGREYYQRGPVKGWTQISQYLAGQVARGKACCDDPWVAALHLKGLLDAELEEPCALGVRAMPEPAEIRLVVERALRVFLAAYGR